MNARNLAARLRNEAIKAEIKKIEAAKFIFMTNIDNGKEYQLRIGNVKHYDQKKNTLNTSRANVL